MKRIYLTIMALFVCVATNFAQNIDFKSSNFKDKKEEFKIAEEQFKKGKEFLELANEAIALVVYPGDNFLLALKEFEKAQAFNPNNAELNMSIGNCYIYSNEKYKAKAFIEKAHELDKEVDPFLHFLYGRVLQFDMQWEKAVDEYKLFETTARNKHAEEYKKITSKYKKECGYGKEMLANKSRAWVDKVPEVNSPADEYSPCLTADGEMLLFSSNRQNSHQASPIGKFDAEIYSSNYEKKKWTAPKALGAPLNTSNDDVASALAYDGQRLLLHKTVDGKSDVYESKLRGTSWSEPTKKMHFITKDDNSQSFACYEPLDIKVYYITDKGGDRNIDFSGKMAQMDDRWGQGQSAGHMVNTNFHEGSVYIHPDGKTMYFSSQGHNSIGGYDIFVSYWKLGQWTAPINLGYPINTPYDDYYFSSTANGKNGYIASNREGGQGGLDLYKVTFWGPDKTLVIDTEDYLLASKAQPIKDRNIAAAAKVENKSLTVFKGKVIDHISRKPVEAAIDIVDNTTSLPISSFMSNSATGKFLLSLPSGKNYGISVKADGYLFHSENFNLPEDSEFNLVDKEVELKNIKIGSKIELRNIFFSTGKADLSPESNSELDRLVKLMQDVPSLKIEVSGHTDNEGSEPLNAKLSQDRANSVMAYLTKKGVTASRMTAKGYGSSKPIAENDSSEGRARNRRTELEITGN